MDSLHVITPSLIYQIRSAYNKYACVCMSIYIYVYTHIRSIINRHITKGRSTVSHDMSKMFNSMF